MPFISQVVVGLRPQLAMFGNDYKTSDGTVSGTTYIHVVNLSLIYTHIHEIYTHMQTCTHTTISETNWDALFSEDMDLDIYCALSDNTHLYLYIMEACIPKKVLPPRKCNLPWFNKSLVQSMRRRDYIF